MKSWEGYLTKSTGRGAEKGGGLEFLEGKGTKLSGTFYLDVGELSGHGSKHTYMTKNTGRQTKIKRKKIVGKVGMK